MAGRHFRVHSTDDSCVELPSCGCWYFAVLMCRPQDSCTRVPDRLSTDGAVLVSTERLYQASDADHVDHSVRRFTQNGVVGCYQRRCGFQQATKTRRGDGFSAFDSLVVVCSGNEPCCPSRSFTLV